MTESKWEQPLCEGPAPTAAATAARGTAASAAAVDAEAAERGTGGPPLSLELLRKAPPECALPLLARRGVVTVGTVTVQARERRSPRGERGPPPPAHSLWRAAAPRAAALAMVAACGMSAPNHPRGTERARRTRRAQPASPLPTPRARARNAARARPPACRPDRTPPSSRRSAGAATGC
jgi:hypothetical protein